MVITFATFCSGIGCPEVAVRGMDWTCIAQAEIEPFPCRVLAHHYPHVPNLGDITAPDFAKRLAAVGLPDVVIAGIPCQPFSVAGKRGGLDDKRNLTQVFVEIANAIDDLRVAAGLEPATWVVENVPGLLSDKGNALGCLLGALAGSGAAVPQPANGSWPNAGVVAGPRRVCAWRVLDAQHFGVGQRRRRVFLLARGGAGAWTCADALLPLGEGVRGNPAASRTAREGPAADAARCAPSLFNAEGGGAGGVTLTASNVGRHVNNQTPLLANPLDAHHPRNDLDNETFVAHAFDARQSNVCQYGDRTGPIDTDGQSIGVLLHGSDGTRSTASLTDTAQITSKANRTRVEPDAPASTLAKGSRMHAATELAVRRLLPVETERLQGLPDDWTAIPGAKDGPRYRAIGNGMAVPCLTWLAKRIEANP